MQVSATSYTLQDHLLLFFFFSNIKVYNNVAFIGIQKSYTRSRGEKFGKIHTG